MFKLNVLEPNRRRLNMKKHLILVVNLAFFSTCAIAQPKQSCEDYPYGQGIDVQAENGGTKILSTGRAAVSMDDVDPIMDAQEEATMKAKAQIAKFLNEDIQSDSTITKVVNESKQSDGTVKKVNRDELIARVKTLRNSTSALLRGVVPLGSCYTKAREYRVTVGLKPETIAAAERTAGAINSSVSRQPASQTGQTGGSAADSGKSSSGSDAKSNSLQGMPGHSDTSRINKF